MHRTRFVRTSCSIRDVSHGSHKRIWWVCEKGHEWQAQINARTRGTGCPVCANKKVLVGVNDLATTHPELAAQWHPVKNGRRTPQSVACGSRAKVWWRCGKGHEWQAIIASRSVGGAGCPVCDGKQVLPGDNDLESQFPRIAAQWDREKNAQKPSEVTAFSNRKAWWRCEQGHSYQAAIAQRTQAATGCPYCAGRKVLAGFNDLETVAPQIAAQWHETLNGELTPRMVTAGSKKKIWWQCSDGHVWKAVVYSRTGKRKAGCPVCAGKVKRSF